MSLPLKPSAATTAKQIHLFDISESLEKALETPNILKRNSVSTQKQQDQSRRQSKLPSINQTATTTAAKQQFQQQSQQNALQKADSSRSLLAAPQKNRRTSEIQTDPFLEPLPLVLETGQAFTQTDEFLPRPPSPLFIPKSSGLDKETQILAGDLFDFDLEIAPVVESIVGQCIEHAWIEATEELELERIKVRMRVFERRRINERAEILRLEEAEKRRQEEKIRRLEEQLDLIRKREQTETLSVVQEMAHSSVNKTMAGVYQVLGTVGYLQDQTENQFSSNVWNEYLMPQLSEKLLKVQEAQNMLDQLIMVALSA